MYYTIFDLTTSKLVKNNYSHSCRSHFFVATRYCFLNYNRFPRTKRRKPIAESIAISISNV